MSSQAGSDGRTPVQAAGDRTLQQYHQWMQTNAAAHLIRVARETGITARLRERQHTLQEICELLSLRADSVALLLDALVSLGFVERYDEDYALARAGHLLCQYDEDLGDTRWQQLEGRLKQGPPTDAQEYRARRAATQWVHTSAAMQAGEILNIGGQEDLCGLRILDLGCGSAVWSCALAHRDAQATVQAVDTREAIAAASQMASSIGLSDRFQTLEGDPDRVAIPEQSFDLVLLAQQLSCRPDDAAAELLRKAAGAAKPGGRVVIADLFRGPQRPTLTETVQSLEIHLATEGRVRSLPQAQQLCLDAGLVDVQFTFLAASPQGLGLIVCRADERKDSGN